MEVRLRLGRHDLKGEMLVVEYRRMEVEDAAWKGLQVAGMVVAFAALGGLAVVAGKGEAFRKPQLVCIHRMYLSPHLLKTAK